MFRNLLLIYCLLAFGPVYAHEFWISPVKYQVKPGEKIEAHFRVGSEYKGPPQVFLQSRTTQHKIAIRGKIKTLPGRNGDRPAMQATTRKQGLVTLIHETADSEVNYQEWDKFIQFVEHKDFADALQVHEERGLPQTGFVETYRRFAKSLVAVGHGKGEDVRAGLDIEIVALANPYVDDLSDGLPVQVFLRGAPRVDTQVELFERAITGTINITYHRTDDQGIVVLPMNSRSVYMVDSVALEERDGMDDGEPVWHSLWANLTFEVP